jgi:hypothetical protein
MEVDYVREKMGLPGGGTWLLRSGGFLLPVYWNQWSDYDRVSVLRSRHYVRKPGTAFRWADHFGRHRERRTSRRGRIVGRIPHKTNETPPRVAVYF